MKPNSIFFCHHTREQITEMAHEGYAVVVPLAATEQHGKHLPVSTDGIIGEYVAQESVARAANSVPLLLAPMLSIGCSEHHLRFGGTISFKTATYMQLLKDIGESLVASGFNKIIFLNSHGGNEPLMMQTANDLAVAHRIWTACASYWSLARQALNELNASEVGVIAGHAGGFETSLMLYLKPELVLTNLMPSEHRRNPWIGAGPTGAFIGKHAELTGADGYTDTPNLATAERGRAYARAIVDAVSNWLISTYHTMKDYS